MTDLFTPDTDDDTTALEQPPELASPKQVRLLEAFFYRREAVRAWTREKAETVLRRCQQEERIALNRAARLAREADGVVARGQVSALERGTAADAIDAALPDGVDETLVVLSATLYVLTDDETRRLAGYLIRVCRGLT